MNELFLFLNISFHEDPNKRSVNTTRESTKNEMDRKKKIVWTKMLLQF